MTGLPPSSPYVVQFGLNGAVFTATITFNNATRALQNIRLDRSADLTRYSALTINGVSIGSPTAGGTLTVAGPALAGFGLHVFEDIGPIGLV
jgi:hypothetical protein